MKSKELLIDKVQIPETRVTSYFDNDVYEQFKRTVEQFGVLEPIIVVAVDDSYYLVDGLHRLIEAKNKGDARINAVIIEGDEKDIYLTNLFLNQLRGKPKIKEQREVINLLYKDYKMGTNDICEKTGMTQAFIEDLLIISELPAEILDAFDDARLAKGKALELAKLPTAELQLRVFYQIDGRNLTVENVREIISMVMAEIGNKPAPAQDQGPAPVHTLTCSFCGVERAVDMLKSVFVCGECESLLRYELLQLSKSTLGPTAGDKAAGGS
jgi:ParB/RepB/Spo0J family partition protein